MNNHEASELRLMFGNENLARRNDELRYSERWMTTLAHELRDPLNAIVLALGELDPVCADEPAARLARDVAEHRSRYMARVIDNILDLFRFGRGEMRIRKESVDLAKVVAGAVETTRPAFASRGHTLRVSLPPAPIRFMAQATQLEQVLTNLLANAAKNTPDHGSISVQAECVANLLVLRIRDNGVGIPADLLPEIFDLYRQGRDQDDRYRGGLGIGLALVTSLVQLHGGTVEAQSDGPGHGAEFIVRLPLDDEPSMKDDTRCRRRAGESSDGF